MDKKTATLTLTEKLREGNNYHVIVNYHYQKKILEESIACYQIGEIVAFGSYAIRDSLKNKNSALYEKLEPKADYLFIENFEIDKRATASSFAIIGEEEINQLRNTFYKNVPDDVEVAMKVLDIKNYAELYEKYSNGELNKELSEIYPLFLKFKNSLRDMFCVKNSYFPTYKVEEYLKMERKEINKILNERGIDNAYSWSDDTVNQSSVKDIVGKLETVRNFDLLPSFINFVFTIPHEDQNIEVNKTILKLPCETLDYVKILTEEYFKGKSFPDYFDCLDSKKQKKVINALEFKKADNSVYNSFLWSRGFRTIGLDHLRLYKEDTKGFIEYFNTKSAEEKKAIIQDLMKSDITNEEVVNWLTKNHMDLVREVGLND